jgi:hypothetical protein
MTADKTVGGLTRLEWNMRAYVVLSVQDRRALDALLDAAFDSRGLREGLERAAEVIKPLLEELDHLDGAEYVLERALAAIATARAEASKLDGEEQPYTLTKAVAEAALDVTRPFREARAAARQPEPPAEERRDAHAFVVGPVPDYCHFTAGGGRCNQSRAWHEPAEERKLPLGHEFVPCGLDRYAPGLRAPRHDDCHALGCRQPRSAHEQEG